MKQVLLLASLFTTFFIQSVDSFAQTTIVNYTFNSGASYAELTPVLAPNVTATASSTEPFTTFNGTGTGAAAFTATSIAGQALGMNNSSGNNSRYFEFTLGGTSYPLILPINSTTSSNILPVGRLP
ncbi:hypothetical protein [Hymenobacter sp. AT01-02]|uniref:hypothetical protein n=1 Tax=Hymenobacter sp. AT01-02 TaxID=1571877 RepID=UPI0005F252E0|nr:hypothetical protein [Hymenobacter sp. AT01-02]